MTDSEDHDPFNDHQLAHPRARQLMADDILWDCVDEEAPFGSDEGATAYDEFRAWRSSNPAANLTDCLMWIMDGRLSEYSSDLLADAVIERDLETPDEAFLAHAYDVFTLDATVIATALAQLVDEGRIDPEAKPYVRVAISRQSHPKLLTSPNRKTILETIACVVDAA